MSNLYNIIGNILIDKNGNNYNTINNNDENNNSHTHNINYNSNTIFDLDKDFDIIRNFLTRSFVKNTLYFFSNMIVLFYVSSIITFGDLLINNHCGSKK